MPTVAPLLKENYDDPRLRTNCSGFFKAISKRLDPALTPDLAADAIIDNITKSAKWVKIGAGQQVGTQAALFAAQGYLVVALLKAADHQPKKDGKPYTHGHLAIVLPDAPLADYPYVISGSIVADGMSDGTKRVRGVWRGIDAPNVTYYRTSSTFEALKPQAVAK